MISFIVGTTAELIKIAPVHHAIAARGTRPQLWFTAQHMDKIAETLADLKLPEPDVWLVPKAKAVHVNRPAQVPGWAATVASTAWSRRAELRDVLTSDGRPPLVMVHGDTFSTPYGSFVGKKVLRARVAHIEAGMRSGSATSPFPEEINRRIATRLTDIHLAPTHREVKNLAHARGIVVDTGANTVIDSVRAAMTADVTMPDLPAEFGLATLHRFELVSREDKFREVLHMLRDASRQTPILYLAGAPERERIENLGLGGVFDDERFLMRPKVRYTEFLPLLTRAKFVVTDSGGLQEECAYLGVPAAIHRERTERHQGLDRNIVLTEMRANKFAAFLADYESLRFPSLMDKYHPTEIIANTLGQLGFC
ncbi:UDP-N-acetylglucosamine 2-epimerase [Actinocrispum wychmicini]|uniref:UDP-N-acetylglucosamine 2-epimerase (Non-hydrolysing) n=1 Tax=Actinocrispum wychmicini TaxID=1213861 RepID=A0A4V2S8P9_9PSEU|nr:UDP-N-acetylglucosamine 2-epimerase [Actinocrispum wychmicini]TCO64490.1 UDP-N-acetylglucosamine 2-epimerase (non-hydrolysing) [Actinocrispum wychmicini]